MDSYIDAEIDFKKLDNTKDQDFNLTFFLLNTQ